MLYIFVALGFISAASAQPLDSDQMVIQYYNSGYSDPLTELLVHDAATYGGKIQMVEPLTDMERIKLWHLSEGSDVFPLLWFDNIRSGFSNNLGSKISEDLNRKFGVIAEPTEYANQSPYPLKWIGLSSSWSGAPPQEADVHLSPGAPLEAAFGVKEINGEKSIAMVGVNCAFCHSGVVSVRGKDGVLKDHFIEGNPGLLSIRGFFQDMFASTAKTMLDEKLLEQFLNDTKVKGDTRAIAADFTKRMKARLKLDGLLSKIAAINEKTFKIKYLINKKNKTIRQTFYDQREDVEEFLTELLKITYDLPSVSKELQLRMKFLSVSIGLDPDLMTTPEGFARTDAFGRIANLVARTKDPIPLTATASVPAMWNIQNRALFHWNANTNSVIMRNIGQSFGLGALVLDDTTKDSTSNIHNLHQLEELLYRVRAPVYTDVDKDFSESWDNIQSVLDGCDTYHAKCIGCHGGPQAKGSFVAERVGPAKSLILYNVISLDKIGTDKTYTFNQAKPVGDEAFRDALFKFTASVKNRYYEKNNVTKSEQALWEKTAARGPELFRDTVLGENRFSGDSSYMNIGAKPQPGYPARHLGGIWATAPYLHNGSVPNLMELLTPQAQRSKVFFVGTTEYDRNRLGFFSGVSKLPNIIDLKNKARDLLRGHFPKLKAKFVKHFPKLAKKLKSHTKEDLEKALIEVACDEYPTRCFDSTLTGNTNVGHSGALYGTDLGLAKKRNLIQFLKVLRPEVEYSVPTLKPLYKWDESQRKCVKP